MVDAYGVVTWWGFTPSISLFSEDIVEETATLQIEDEGTSPASSFTALLVGCGDCRHILKTVSGAWRNPGRQYTFYVIENNVEVLARHMLLLRLVLESPDRFGLQEKSEMFLEIFGNLLIREQTSEYIARTATDFIKLSRKLKPLIMQPSKTPEAECLVLIAAYIIENKLKVLAQQMLKSERFMKIFGNLRMGKQTSKHVARTATDFIEMVTDLDHLADVFPLFDLSSLKFKERDHLEAIFKFWRNPDKTVFDAGKLWDNRLRAHLRTRYDSRLGAYDWDYNMKLAERGGDVIHKTEYSTWRDTGVAFQMREGSYTTPNKTLASGLILKAGGEKVARRGYWGDIICSPFLAFGIKSENKELFKKANGVYTKTSTDISEYNVLSCLHELIRHEKHLPPKPNINQKEGVKITEIIEEVEEVEQESTEPGGQENIEAEHDTEKPGIVTLENVNIVFLPIGMASEIHKKAKYHSLFDVIYFSNSMVHHLTPAMSEVLKDRASVVCETAKFMIDLKKEQCQEFVSKVTGMAARAGCKMVGSCDGFKDNFMKFRFSSSPDDRK